jgi:hypothetical protein
MEHDGNKLIILMEKMLCSLAQLIDKTLPSDVDPTKIPPVMDIIVYCLKGLAHLHASGLQYIFSKNHFIMIPVKKCYL